MITVVNIKLLNLADDYDHVAGGTYRNIETGAHLVYCGRRNISYHQLQSPLANPYGLDREANRKAILSQYQRWFDGKVQDGDASVADELARLINLASEGDLELACYCSPRACHCDIVKKFIEEPT